jgi:hypothetical protein
MEVGRERPHEPDRRGRLDLREERGRRAAVRADQGADALDQLEQLLALLTDERTAEQ